MADACTNNSVLQIFCKVINYYVHTYVKVFNWYIYYFISGGFIIIGVIIYGAEAEYVYAEFSGAFGITIIAGIVSLVAGILCLLDWMGKSMWNMFYNMLG